MTTTTILAIACESAARVQFSILVSRAESPSAARGDAVRRGVRTKPARPRKKWRATSPLW
eukprot:2668914-Prymnesium_polylepis.1